MKVKFFAYYRAIFNAKEIIIKEFRTVNELVIYLCNNYGKKASEIFYKNGQFSDDVIIMVNGRHIEHLNMLETKLKDSDTVSIFPVVAGG